MRYEKGQIIGLGGEKRIFEDAHNPQRVVAEFRRGDFKKNANQIKAQYYLGKILKMLFPKKVPDIHAAGKVDKDFLLLEKIERDADHKLVQEISAFETEGKKVPHQLIEKREKTLAKIKEKYQTRIPKLNDRFGRVGILIDSSHPLNFSLGPKNSLVYLDNIVPWKLDRHYRQIYWNIDVKKLKYAIDRLPQNTQNRAKNLFTRLLQLYEEDKKSLRVAN